MGLEFANRPSLIWIGLCSLALAASIGLGIYVGPGGIFVSSSTGILLALLGLFFNRKQTFLIVLTGMHVLLIIGGFFLKGLFLKPLPDDSLQMPRLSQKYRDPAGFFEVRAPEGWTVERIKAPNEAGVRLRPSDRQQYMGVSELTVRVRKLANPTADPVIFLGKMAQTMQAKPKNDKKLFEFSTRSAQLLNGDQGMWSHLIVKRFWVPLYQLALYGIKEKRYLCTVSATGLKNHATLSEVLCLGVFHTIKIRPDHS